MSEKRPLQWKGILLSLCLTLALYGGGILLLTLLTVRGVLDEEQLFLTLAIGAACASLIGGMMAGKRVGAAGSLLNAGADRGCVVAALPAQLGGSDREGYHFAGRGPAGRCTGSPAKSRPEKTQRKAIGKI